MEQWAVLRLRWCLLFVVSIVAAAGHGAGDRGVRPGPSLDPRLRAIISGWSARPFEAYVAGVDDTVPFRDGASVSLSSPELMRSLNVAARRIPADVPATRSLAALELAAGNAALAVSRLETAVDSATDSVVLHADLAGALRQLAFDEEYRPRAAYLRARAMEASLSALSADPMWQPARHNFRLAAEDLGLRFSDDQDWLRYLREPTAVAAGSQVAAWPRIKATLGDVAVPLAQHIEIQAGFSQAYRELLEDELLPQWAEAVLARRPEQAALVLNRVTELADALKRSGGDGLAAAAVVAISPNEVEATARGLMAYGRGRRLYESTERERALEEFAHAVRELKSAGSAFVLRAQLHQAIAEFQVGQRENAEAEAVLVAAQAGRLGFGSVRAGAEWLAGIADTQSGNADVAIGRFRKASALFVQLGELEDAAATLSSGANTYRLLGDADLGWEWLGESVKKLGFVVSPRRIHTIMLNASLFASDEGLLRAALFFQNCSVSAAQTRGVASTLAEGYLRRATIEVRLGRFDVARHDLEAARQIADEIKSSFLQKYVTAWISRASALQIAASDPQKAAAAIPPVPIIGETTCPWRLV